MECQYAHQKKKAIVPLKLTDGYEADGWLGLLLGTSLWYAFYGETLSSESAFESRVESLARELGARGQREAVVDGDDECSRVGAVMHRQAALFAAHRNFELGSSEATLSAD